MISKLYNNTLFFSILVLAGMAFNVTIGVHILSNFNFLMQIILSLAMMLPIGLCVLRIYAIRDQGKIRRRDAEKIC